MDCNTNCDFRERLKQLQSVPPKQMIYGKKKLESHLKYDLINDDNSVNTSKLSVMYDMFKYNILQVIKAGLFEWAWVDPDDIITATKGKIWGWSNDKEKEFTKNSIETFGLHFPIFTLPLGIPHNQIDEIPEDITKNLYNSYNGNHRIDAIQELHREGRYNKKVLIIIIPPFCEKSCTGFRYTPIDYQSDRIPDMVLEHPTQTVTMFHLRFLEDEMHIYNMPTEHFNVWDGIDVVNVIDYQAAFRILQEFQNALEIPLLEVDKDIQGTGPHNLESSTYGKYFSFEGFIDKEIFDKFINMDECLFTSFVDTCNIRPLDNRMCSKPICCKICPKECYSRCTIIGSPVYKERRDS